MDLTKGSIPKHIKHIAIPASVGFFFNTMYNVTDTFYAGLLSTDALAALSLSFPIFFIIIALSSFSQGATALISNALGAKKLELARKYSYQAISLAAVIGVILTFVGLWGSPFLFSLLGASDQYLQLSLDYMNVILIGAVFFTVQFAINSTLISMGDTKSFRNFLVIGFFLNLILNPIFMFGWIGFPAMGLTGIALATIIIELLGTLYLAYRFMKTRVYAGMNGHFRLKKNIVWDITYQGIPAGFNMFLVAVGTFILTFFVSQYGQAAVAAYGSAVRIEQIALLPTIGLNMAVLSLVGQNNGAKKFERVRESWLTSMRYGFYISLIGFLFMFFLAAPLVNIFSSDPTVIQFGAEYLRVAAFLGYAYVIVFMAGAFLQGIKKPYFNLWLGITRQVIAPLIIFWILVFVFQRSLFEMWLGLAGIMWLSATILFWYAYHQLCQCKA